MNSAKSQHISVLLRESVQALLQTKGNIFVDATFGGGGHTAEIFRLRPDARVYAFDLDQNMLDSGATRFQEEIKSGHLTLIHANYGDIRLRLADLGVHSVDGVLVDAGVSSFQIDQPERGFSFSKSGPLDMRMDQSQALTAFEVANHWPQQELERIFFEYGEERFSRKIAARIVEKRTQQTLADTISLAKIVADCLPRPKGPVRGIHPATRVFQAIRIAVNGELASLERLLGEIPEILNPGGVFAAIAFHSLEDRLIKERLRYLCAACVCPLTVMTCARCNRPDGFMLQKKPIIATDEEITQNPRARSAKLRVFLKNP